MWVVFISVKMVSNFPKNQFYFFAYFFSHESELTTASVSKNFVQRPDFSELSSLNSAVITSVIYNISKMFHSGKKR